MNQTEPNFANNSEIFHIFALQKLCTFRNGNHEKIQYDGHLSP